MKILFFIYALLVITACNETETKQFKQATCNVEYESFTYISKVIDNTQTNFTIKVNQITLESSRENIATNLSTDNTLSYRGSKDIGTLSYINPKTHSTIELGAIGYLCWSGLRTNFKNKISFEETIRKK